MKSRLNWLKMQEQLKEFGPEMEDSFTCIFLHLWSVNLRVQPGHPSEFSPELTFEAKQQSPERKTTKLLYRAAVQNCNASRDCLRGKSNVCSVDISTWVNWAHLSFFPDENPKCQVIWGGQGTLMRTDEEDFIAEVDSCGATAGWSWKDRVGKPQYDDVKTAPVRLPVWEDEQGSKFEFEAKNGNTQNNEDILESWAVSLTYLEVLNFRSIRTFGSRMSGSENLWVDLQAAFMALMEGLMSIRVYSRPKTSRRDAKQLIDYIDIITSHRNISVVSIHSGGSFSCPGMMLVFVLGCFTIFTVANKKRSWFAVLLGFDFWDQQVRIRLPYEFLYEFVYNSHIIHMTVGTGGSPDNWIVWWCKCNKTPLFTVSSAHTQIASMFMLREHMPCLFATRGRFFMTFLHTFSSQHIETA